MKTCITMLWETDEKVYIFQCVPQLIHIIPVQDREEVGCDIESIRSVRRETAERVFLPEEQEWMKEKETDEGVRGVVRGGVRGGVKEPVPLTTPDCMHECQESLLPGNIGRKTI